MSCLWLLFQCLSIHISHSLHYVGTALTTRLIPHAHLTTTGYMRNIFAILLLHGKAIWPLPPNISYLSWHTFAHFMMRTEFILLCVLICTGSVRKRTSNVNQILCTQNISDQMFLRSSIIIIELENLSSNILEVPM